MSSPCVEVRRLGPAVTGFPIMSSILIDDVLYLGSRNLAPPRVVGIHLPTWRVLLDVELPTGVFVQALCHDRRYIYAGVTHSPSAANIHRIDISTKTAVPWAAIPDMYVRDLVSIGDGRLAVVGRQPHRCTGPGLWVVGPDRSVAEVGVPDPEATQGLCAAMCWERLFVGTGANLGGAGGHGAMVHSWAIPEPDSPWPAPLDCTMQHDTAALATRALAGTAAALWAGTEGSQATLSKLCDNGTDSSREFAAKAVTRVLPLGSGGAVVATAEPFGLWRVSADLQEADLLTDILPGGEVWGLHLHQGRIWASMSGGWVVDVALDEDEGVAERGARLRHVTSAGVVPQPQLGMSLAAYRTERGLEVLTAGNFTVQRHLIDVGEVIDLTLPGEAKDICVVGSWAYFAVYNSQGIWALNLEDPDARPQKIVSLPLELNRPQTIVWDPYRQLVCVGIQCDWSGTGALALYDPTTNTSIVEPDPLPQQLVRCVQPVPDGIWLGGESQSDRHASGLVGWWQPGQQTRIVARTRRFGVSAIVPGDGGVLILTTAKDVLRLDRTGEVRTLAAGEAHQSALPRVAVHCGRHYVITAACLAVLDLDSGSLEPLCALGGEWYSGPRVSVFGNYAYTLSGRELVQVPLLSEPGRTDRGGLLESKETRETDDTPI